MILFMQHIFFFFGQTLRNRGTNPIFLNSYADAVLDNIERVKKRKYDVRCNRQVGRAERNGEQEAEATGKSC